MEAIVAQYEDIQNNLDH